MNRKNVIVLAVLSALALHLSSPTASNVSGQTQVSQAWTETVVLAPLDTTTLYAVADAYVDSATPTKNYGSATTLYVGNQTPSAVDRALFRFDLSGVPLSAVIDSATFRVYMNQAPSTPPLNLDVGVYRITESWIESSVVWGNQPAVLPIGKINGVGMTLQYYEWEVTDLVQNWLATPATNFGLELRSEIEGTVAWRGFASREAPAASRPQLVIEFHLPTCNDLQEPNDTFGQAFLILPAIEYLGCIPTPSDLDYFRFDVAPNTAISVELFNLPANYDLYLYDPAEALLDSSANAGTTSEVVEYTTGPAGGQFYAKVQSGGEWDLYNPYALKLTLTAVPVWPDLVINDVWREDGQVCYEIENIGQATALQGHQTSLRIDGLMAATDSIGVDLAPGAVLQRCFVYPWQCTLPQDTLIVCADYADDVAESVESNNCIEEIWPCDTSPPVIVTGPTASNITSAGVTVSWTTDEASDSTVLYGRKAGLFEGEVSDASLTQAHVIALTGLQPSATYRYIVRSADAAGNAVTSREMFFTTGPESEMQVPSISGVTLTRVPGDPIYYNIAATLPSGQDLERMEFYMDGELIGKAYAPKSGAPPWLYEFPLIPAALGMSREEFFTGHEIEAVAIGFGGLMGRFSVPFDPPYECDKIRVAWVRPDEDEILYTPGDQMPPGDEVRIEVTAYQMTARDCLPFVLGAAPRPSDFHCAFAKTEVISVEFKIDGVLKRTLPGNSSHTYVYDWNTGGLGLGDYQIRVDAIASEECKQTAIRYVTVARGEPSLEVSREVTRHDNYFEVALTVENRGTLGLAVDRIEDNLAGFQLITKTSVLPQYQVTADCRDFATTCDVAIDVSGDVGGWAETLMPGEHLLITYLVVPVLYPEADDVDHAIGSEPVIVHVIADPSQQSFDRPFVVTSGGETLAEAVTNAQATADYLIVTHPVRLYALHNDHNSVNALLATMAELAQLKNGILGYLTGDIYSDEEAVHEVILAWGRDMRGSDGVVGNYLSNGYLLIIGEVDVVASYTKRFECWEPWFPNQTVDYTDLPFGNTEGNWKNPELIVSRIIGDDPAELMAPIMASINVFRRTPDYRWDRSHALAIAGRGTRVGTFEDDVDTVADELDDRFSVLKWKQKDIEEGGGDIKAMFLRNVAGRDVVFYVDHCNASQWGGDPNVIAEGDFLNNLVDFGTTKPFAFACCCKAGRYENVGDTSIAEEFLKNGAATYIGAVEDSYIDWNSDACPGFFERWVNTDDSIGQAFRDLKRDLNGYMEKMWAAQYNLYGDPKYGGTETVGPVMSTLRIAASPVFSHQVTIPDYQVRQSEDWDYVRIPGGGLVLQPGKPRVPDYAVELIYPAGYEVQGVTLGLRDGLTTTTGLHIPDVALDIAIPSLASGPATDNPGWWPQEIFIWDVQGLADGTSLLTIRSYPFYYDSTTTDVMFYKNYRFDIQVIASATAIPVLTTDRRTYEQGEIVTAGFWVTHTGASQDIVVSAIIKSESSDEVVDGLLLRTLNGIQSLGFYSLQWDSTGFAPDHYAIEVELRNEEGSVLTRAYESFRIGIAAGEISTFTVTPTLFDIGAQVAVSLTFANTGTVPLTGTAVVQIQTEAGEVVQEFNHDYGDLASGNSIDFADVWDTSAAVRGSYRIVAYVLYESTATEPGIASVRTNWPIYLPLVLKAPG